MAKKASKKDERQERWEKLLEAYRAQNPVKYAEKEARGEFKEIPPTFA